MKLSDIINNHLTKNEQKVLYFVLTVVSIGLIVQMYGYETPTKSTLGDKVERNAYVNKKLANDFVPRFNLVTATVEELEYISGIGPATAESIVEYQQNVGFTSIEDLMNIRGIGVKKFDIYKDFLYVNNDVGLVVADSLPKQMHQIPSKTVFLGKININTASLDDLIKLRSIGPSRAQTIIDYRVKNKFKKKEEIMNVKGIGVKIYEQIQEFIVVEDD